jgi:signal transduction histidine kinase/DNA-binding response OmpR family regulator
LNGPIVTTSPRVLIVDDDPMNRDILQTLLAAHDLSILTATDGEEALAIAREKQPDLILLDVMMPKVDGIEVCRRLKSDPTLPFMPIIMVTARADSKDIVAGLGVGADEYLTKPVDPDALVARVKSMLRIKDLHDTVQRQAAQLAESNRALRVHSGELAQRVEQLGALSEIGQAVSSTLDLETMLRTIVARATQLAGADAAVMSEYDQQSKEFQPRASHNLEQEIVDAFTRAPLRKGEGAVGRVADTHEAVQIADIAPPGAYESGLRGVLTRFGYRALLGVPLLREDQLIGALVICRKAPGEFAADVVDLLTTFAAQSALAIQNARLYTETTRREREATKLYEITSQLASNLDADRVLDLITAQTIELLRCDASGLYTYDGARGGLTFHRGIHLDLELTRDLVLTPGEGVAGRAFQERHPVWTVDRLADPALRYTPTADLLIQAKAPRAYMAVPILSRGEVFGVLVDYFFEPHEFTPKELQLLSTLADHAAIAIENVRLLREIQAKSRQLEAASRHKSEFLANMSHELRTPLNAVIGFSEVLLQRMFGDLNDKQDEYLKDIYASGQHLLSLINDILDLSKIEAGRMELASAPFHLPSALENAVTLVKERAGRHGITLQLDIDPRLGELVGDERKVKQILLNLLSNAVKFTPEGGRISLKAVRRDGLVQIAVTDTGVGIAREDQAAIFDEFRQVGSDETRKQEGTGLGLTLAKKFVELHGGRIWVESEVGSGSTFTFTLPVS